MRPDEAGITGLSANSSDKTRFSISHRPVNHGGWLELLANGLTFDVTGLAPAAAATAPPVGTLLGIDRVVDGEAIDLLPGPHLAQGRTMMPVIRALAGLGAVLSTLPGILAVCWRPSGAWIEPGYFRKIVGDWLHGGPFPALGLVTLHPRDGGWLASRGLSLFSGQELELVPPDGMSTAQLARIAVRLLHELVDRPAIVQPVELAGPGGELIALVPDTGGASVRVSIAPRH